MKALFSTKYLAEQLEKALKNKGFNQIDFVQKEWILNRHDAKPVTLIAEYTRDSNGPDAPSLIIDRAQWYRLLQFLKLLPEQPICLELDFWDAMDVRIRLTQFVADF